MSLSLASWEPLQVAVDEVDQGDALREVLREAEPFLRSLAFRMCRNEQDARDLVQDTFEHALRADRVQLANARAYLSVILKHLFIDGCRKVARRPAVVPFDDHDHELAAPEHEPLPAWSRASVADVRAALEELGPDFRRVYEMHVFEHRSYDEIAQALGIQRLTVGSRLTRARQRLRAILCRRFGEEAPPS